ncbi:hypothetical protein [Frankia sp. Cr2]|uniref:hypothetical protein n=1 Tax=Frankia sp. Cr2 TaxID=3073932 RepID=UPI002AD5772A|nr:hypothetical protein [Frankia sp. Cr2]
MAAALQLERVTMEPTLVAVFLGQIARPIIDSMLGVHKHGIERDVKASDTRLDERRKILWENQSPFVTGDTIARELVEGETRESCLPVVLIAPFYDERKPASQRHDAVGEFRTAIRESLNNAPWASLYRTLDGLLRPLTNSDLDLLRIRVVLSGLPVIVLWGSVKSSAETVLGVRMWGMTKDPNREFVVSSTPIPLPPIPELSFSEGMTALRSFDSKVGWEMAAVAGIGADWFACHHRNLEPVLPRLLTLDTERNIELAVSAATGGVSKAELSPRQRLAGVRSLASAGAGKEARQAIASMADDTVDVWRSEPDAVDVRLAAEIVDAATVAIHVEQREIQDPPLWSGWTGFVQATTAATKDTALPTQTRRIADEYSRAAARHSIADVAASLNGRLGTIAVAHATAESFEVAVNRLWRDYGVPEIVLDKMIEAAASLKAAAAAPPSPGGAVFSR